MTPPTTRRRGLLDHAQATVSAIGKRLPFVLGAAREAVTLARRVSYRRLEKTTPIESRSALFKAYSGRGYACSPRAIYEALLRDARFADFELYWVFREPLAHALSLRGFEVRGLSGTAPATPEIDLDVALGPEALEQLRRSVIVVWGSREHYRAHARTAYWFCNTVIPWHLVPRAGQAYVQMWHGTPLKRLGCDIDLAMANNALYSGRQTHRRYTREGHRFTYLVTPSRFASEKLASAFALSKQQCDAKILELGYPRNDALHSIPAQKIAALRARLGIPEGKKVILYTPTWRDDQHSSAMGYTLQLPLDFDALLRGLGDEYVVLFRSHYLIANSFDFARYPQFVIDVSGISDINDLHAVSDALITDYSSVFFDYANLERPIVFYMYDLETYANDMRGFYLDLTDLPGPIVRSEDELVAAIRSADSPDPELRARYHRFNERFTYLDDGHASERVIERVIIKGSDK